jgi:hypothetical protein
VVSLLPYDISELRSHITQRYPRNRRRYTSTALYYPFPSTKLLEAICRWKATIQSKYISERPELHRPSRIAAVIFLPHDPQFFKSQFSNKTKPSQTKPFPPTLSLAMHLQVTLTAYPSNHLPDPFSRVRFAQSPLTVAFYNSPFSCLTNPQHSTKAAVTTASAPGKRKTEI